MIAIVADVHVGNHRRLGGAVQAGVNERCRAAAGVLQTAYRRALDTGCRAFVIAGDLFDVSRPDPQVVARVREALRRPPQTGQLARPAHAMAVYALRGNHDMCSEEFGDGALAPLDDRASPVENATLFAMGTNSVVVMIPYAARDATEYVRETVRRILGTPESKARDFRALVVFHAGIEDASTPAFLRGARDAVHVDVLRELAAESHVTAFAAGNWHVRKAWGISAAEDGERKLGGREPQILQVGSLCPTGWDDEGLDAHGTLAFWDGVRLTWEVVPGPRFLSAPTDVPHALLKKSLNRGIAEGHSVYLRLLAKPGELKEAEVLRRAIELAPDSWGVPFGQRVKVLVEPAEAAAREAAAEAGAAARAAETLDEAAARYVSSMEVAAGVDRARVLQRARHYLAGGGSP